MVAKVKVTTAVITVLTCLLEDPDADRYGLDLIRASGLASGTLYPILTRLQRAQWLTAAWEDIDPETAGRPARRYYRLTPDGVVAARAEITAVHQRLSKALGSTVKPRPA